MAIYLAWTSAEDIEAHGPWDELRQIAPGLLLIDSQDSLSSVYHAIKWCVGEGEALLVTPVERRPKSRGMARGTTSWLRHRTPH